MDRRTFDNEDDLPRAPLPGLADSCDRFLDWCRPLLTSEEFAATAQSVEEFLVDDSPAWSLQADLEKYDSQPEVESWLDEFWRDRYLGRRTRTPINANYFFLLADAERDQVERAAGLITAALTHKIDVERETLPPTVWRGVPQSMVQHRHLFSTTRIPSIPRDAVRTPYSETNPGPSPARHVVVLHRGHLYRLEVLTPDGCPYSPASLATSIGDLLAADHDRGPGLGHLTTMARPDWAERRRRLVELTPANAAALETVESALFAVALEDATPAGLEGVCRELLAGDSGNRWFDLALTFVVFPDGTAGINGEHTWLDGITISEFVDSVLGRTAAEHAERSGAVDLPAPVATPITFALDERLVRDTRTAGETFAADTAAVATRLVHYPDVTLSHVKRLGISPDAFAQLVLQVAHYRTKGVVGATYESIATRAFRNGRTEAMRVVTPESVALVAALDDPDMAPDQRTDALRAAADAHVERARDCQAGRAPEQHLWELQFRQQRLGRREPIALYDSPGWIRMRHDFLSTSAVTSPNVQVFGFGATSPDCIGVSYGLMPDRFQVHLATAATAAGHLDQFATEIATAADELFALLG